MSAKKELLPALFEPALSLDNKKTGTPRSTQLFERMAARLDEIAANTRGWVKGTIARRGKQSEILPTKKENRKPSRLIIAASRDQKTSNIGNLLPSAAKSRKNGAQSLSDNTQSRIEPRKAEKRLDIAHPGAANSTRNRDKASKKKGRENLQGDSKPLSSIANDKAREERIAEESGNRIAEAVMGGLNKVGGLIKSGAQKVSDKENVKDVVGYGLGGPFYGALKEIKEALPNIASEKPDDEKERKAESKKLINAVQNGNGRKRDEKGRFLGSDQNEARRQIAQTEVAEAQLALDEKEAKKDEKRHRELLRAVRANKRGMLDRFLDRRMGLGGRGRDRIIRERTTGRERNLRGRDARNNRNARNGLLSRAGRVAQGAGKAAIGTLALGGRALGGMARMLPGIGQALALGLAVYDGFQGWNDKELHKQAFGLKDGQEATTGQKASAATASILDMGGLTSGLLGLFGIEFDKAGVAKHIYEFGSNIGKLASDVMTVAGPLLASAWKGLEDLGAKIWNGTKDIGGSIAGFATGIWEKGTQFASDIGAWAKGAINEGAGLITGIWNEAKSAVSGCWASLSSFAAESIAKGGKILSGLWDKATELPGKIVEGAADLAKGALETGGKLLSKGWNTIKDWGASLFGGNEPKAETVNKPTEMPAPEDKAVSSVKQADESKLSGIDIEENSKISVNNSENARGKQSLELLNQKILHSSGQDELIAGLDDINVSIAKQTRLFEERWRKEDAADPYVLEKYSQSGNTATITHTPVISAPAAYGERGIGTTQTQYEISSQNGGSTGTLSQRNLSVFNYGNVKLNSKEYKAYASAKDGLMDVGARVLRYNNAPDRGWNAKTLQEMINIYAPPSENDSKGYAQFLAQKLGVNKDEKIDFRDPKILSGLIRWMPKMEHGADIDEKTAMEAAEAILRGEQANIVGTAPDKLGHYKKFTDKGTVSVDNSGQALRYDAASQGVRLKADGKTVDLSTVKGVDSLKLQQGVNIDKMHPEVVANMAAMAQAYEEKTGEKLEISEGYRDYAEQVRVKRKYGSRAATPGRSTHGAGNTFDIASSKIDRVMANLRAKGVDPVQFFRDYGFERSAYNPNKDAYHDERWHLESVKHRSAQFNADRANLQSGKRTGAEYMAAKERAKYMAPILVAENSPEQESPSENNGKNLEPVQVEKSASLSPATAPASMAFHTAPPAPMAISAREPLPAQSIREIDPAREIKTSSGDNGAIIKLLGEILAEIQAGNKKMTNSAQKGGLPSISMEYDDPAAQGLAADMA